MYIVLSSVSSEALNCHECHCNWKNFGSKRFFSTDLPFLPFYINSSCITKISMWMWLRELQMFLLEAKRPNVVLYKISQQLEQNNTSWSRITECLNRKPGTLFVLSQYFDYIDLIIVHAFHSHRQIWLTMFISLLPNSQLCIVQMVRYHILFWFVEEYNRTKIARHTNDLYELSIVPTMQVLLMLCYFCFMSHCYKLTSVANIMVTGHARDLKM